MFAVELTLLLLIFVKLTMDAGTGSDGAEKQLDKDKVAIHTEDKTDEPVAVDEAPQPVTGKPQQAKEDTRKKWQSQE
jgi:hypothetical protein